MKIKFNRWVILVFICILYTNIPAYATVSSEENTLKNLDFNLNESCIRVCLKDYKKIEKCNTNEMISEYISELNKEN